MIITIDRTTRNLTIGLIAGGLLIGGLAFLASPSGSKKSGATGTPTVLKADPTYFDFGTISMKNGVVKRAVTIQNPTSENIAITQLSTSCMCTSATLKTSDAKQYGPFGMQGHGFIPRIDATLLPNDTATVDVTFDPNAHGPAGVGRISRTVYLENSAGRPLEINFSVSVTP